MQTFGFILEQGLGHRTHALNIQAHAPQDGSVCTRWGLIEHQTTGWTAQLPLLNRNWTVEAGLLTRRAIKEMTAQGSVDALFFHTQVMAVLAAKWLKQIPSIISLDATPLQYDSLGAVYDHKPGSSWLERQKWRLNRNSFRLAKGLVAWSTWAKMGLVEEYEVPPEKVTVIPPGIDMETWQRPQPRRANETMDNTPVKILFVGGNLQRKGGLDLIRAYQSLYREKGQGTFTKEIELHIVTKDDLPKEILSADGQITQPGLHLYQGMTPNSAALKALFHNCDIFCLPTHGDCLPLALIEASAAGLATITTKVGGTAEVVSEQETGFLIPIGDEAALVDRLRLLITNPELRLSQGHRAQQIARQRFDAKRTTGQLFTLLNAATGSGLN